MGSFIVTERERERERERAARGMCILLQIIFFIQVLVKKAFFQMVSIIRRGDNSKFPLEMKRISFDIQGRDFPFAGVYSICSVPNFTKFL